MPTSIDPGGTPNFIDYDPQSPTYGQPNYGPQTGYNYPDYNHILELLLAPLKAQEAERLAALQAQTDAQMELARRGTDLTMGDLADQRAQARRTLHNTLASSGLIDSGAREFKNTQVDHAFKRQQQQAANQLTAQLMALANSLATAQLGSKQSLAEYSRSLLPQIQAQYQPTPTYAYNSGPPLTGSGPYTAPLPPAAVRGY